MHRKGQSCRIQSQPYQFTPLVQQQLLVIVYLQKKGHETTLSIVYKGIVYKGGFWAVLKILGKLRVPSTQAFQLRVFQRVMTPKTIEKSDLDGTDVFLLEE